MNQKSLKLELIEWLSSLENPEILYFLKKFKDNRNSSKDFASELTQEQIEGINRGLTDLEEGRSLAHSEVKSKYGL